MRTVSLGICGIRAAIQPDLREGLPLSDRERPFVTGVNGTLMARRSGPAPGQMALRSRFQARSGLAVRLIRSERSGMLPHVPGRGWLAPLLSGLLSPPGRTEIRTHGMNSRPAGTGGRDPSCPRSDDSEAAQPLCQRGPLAAQPRAECRGVQPGSIHFRPAAGFGCPDSLSRGGSAKSPDDASVYGRI